KQVCESNAAPHAGRLWSCRWTDRVVSGLLRLTVVVGCLVGALGQSIPGIVGFLPGFPRSGAGAFPGITGLLAGLFPGFFGPLARLRGSFPRFLPGLAALVVGGAKRLFSLVAGFFSQLACSLPDAVVNGVFSGLDTLVNRLGRTLPDLPASVPDLVKGVGGLLAGLFHGFGRLVASVLDLISFFGLASSQRQNGDCNPHVTHDLSPALCAACARCPPVFILTSLLRLQHPPTPAAGACTSTVD